MSVPAETVATSAVLLSEMSPQFRVMFAGRVDPLLAFAVVKEAAFVTVAPVGQFPVSLVVGLVMWTVAEAPGARSAGPKLKELPVRVQVPVVCAPSMDQDKSAFEGTVSETVTSWAVPRPLLVTVMT